MQNIGITIDQDNKSLAVAGDQAVIVEIFARVDRFINKISVNKLTFGGEKPSKGGSVYSASQGTMSDGTAGRRGNKQSQQKKSNSFPH